MPPSSNLSAIVWYFADASPWVSAAFGLVGTAVGGAIAGWVALRVASNARRTAEQAWVRDSRQQIYDRFLTAGQRLLAVMEKAAQSPTIPVEARPAVEESYSEYFETYASVQTVAEIAVVMSARNHAYRLQALKDILDGRGPFERNEFDRIAKLVRDARHDTIDAMRGDLGLDDSARPPAGIDYAQAVAEAVREDRSRTGSREPARKSVGR
jgi:hypothetical protein